MIFVLGILLLDASIVLSLFSLLHPLIENSRTRLFIMDLGYPMHRLACALILWSGACYKWLDGDGEGEMILPK